MQRLRQGKPQSFGLAVTGDPQLYHIYPADSSGRLQIAGEPDVLASLDVTLLHSLIIRDLLGLSEEDQAAKKFLAFDHDAARVLEQVRKGEGQVAFIMNPTTIDQIRNVSRAGLVMPQKSTFFFPKLPSGLVLYSFGIGRGA
jgi:uncharacterized protein (DUF1015 family)